MGRRSMNTDIQDRWIAPIILESLRKQAVIYDIGDVADFVLGDPRFRTWAGSSVEGAHHHYDGGLAEHTYEVAMLCQENARLLHYEHELEMDEVFLSALFHDVGKMWDYAKINGNWTGTDHKRNIHHISRSAIEWTKAAEKCGIGSEMQDRILHAILAHHGRREWGSPVAPKSRMAWLLHLCDQLSARMSDCDTNDMLLRRDK
jgi:3'-5' exoribonuclease